MQLYYSDVLAPRKVCAAAKYLKTDVEFIYLDLRKGEQKAPAYLAINPNGAVPALKDGARVVWEADAIMCYLADKTGSDFWPHDGRQIDVLKWLSWNSQHFNRCCGELYFQHVIKSRFGLGPPDRQAVEEAIGAFRKFAAILDAHLQGRVWVVDDRLSVADFSLGVSLPYAGQAMMPVDEFPALLRWHDRLNEIDAWQAPFPDRARDGAAAP